MATPCDRLLRASPGEGHVACATAIAAHCARRCGLSSRPRPAGWDGEWMQLARDDAGDGSRRTRPPAARCTGHRSTIAGLRQRMARWRSGWRRTRRAGLIVDVSVEVACSRADGHPGRRRGLPGDRADVAHRLGYGCGDAIMAPWPGWARAPVTGAQGPRCGAVGAISPLRGPRRRAATHAGPARPRAVWDGAARRCVPSSSTRRSAETPGWEWTCSGRPFGAGCRTLAAACRADVVVCHAGQNASRRSRRHGSPGGRRSPRIARSTSSAPPRR